MRVVHKFRINMPTNVVRMDSLGHPVRVAFQAGLLQLWAEVNPSDAYKTDRVFHVYSTGEPIQEGDTYVGTATNQDEFGYEYVWHVYERTN
jgi:hypothetical protein